MERRGIEPRFAECDSAVIPLDHGPGRPVTVPVTVSKRPLYYAAAAGQVRLDPYAHGPTVSPHRAGVDFGATMLDFYTALYVDLQKIGQVF